MTPLSLIIFLSAGAIPWARIIRIAFPQSFISLKIILPVVLKFLGDEAQILALIKPQFEVAREEVGKGGVVQDPAIHDRVVQDISGFCKSLNFEV